MSKMTIDENAQGCTTKKTITNKGIVDKVELSKLFKETREQLGVSIKTVSTEIRLKVKVIEKLESNKFEEIAVPAVYLRGYVINYANYLNIPLSEVEKYDFSGPTNQVNNDFTSKVAKHKEWAGKFNVEGLAKFFMFIFVFLILICISIFFMKTDSTLKDDHLNMSNEYKVKVDNQPMSVDDNSEQSEQSEQEEFIITPTEQ